MAAAGRAVVPPLLMRFSSSSMFWPRPHRLAQVIITAVSLSAVSRSKKIVRSGDVYLYYGYLRAAGSYGSFWSASGLATTTAFRLSFDDSVVLSSYGPHDRHQSFSLRCLQE